MVTVRKEELEDIKQIYSVNEQAIVINDPSSLLGVKGVARYQDEFDEAMQILKLSHQGDLNPRLFDYESVFTESISC